MTEAELYEQIEPMAHLHGYRIAHFRPAWTEKGWRTPVQGDGKDFPDVVLARTGRVLFWELKMVGKKPTAGQQDWLDATGGSVKTPLDLESGLIEKELELA